MANRHVKTQVGSRGFGDEYGNVTRFARVKLTATQIRALFTTPQVLVPNPGAGKLIQIIKVVAYLDFQVAVFTGANNLEIRETGAAGTKVTADLTSAFLDAAADEAAEVGGIEAQTTRLINKDIVVAVPVANPGGATATSTLTFVVSYNEIKAF